MEPTFDAVNEQHWSDAGQGAESELADAGLGKAVTEQTDVVGFEGRRQVGAEGGGVPGHQFARLALVRDAGDDGRNHIDGRNPVEHAGHALELTAERFEGFRPAFGELSPDRVGLGGRMLGAPGRSR